MPGAQPLKLFLFGHLHNHVPALSPTVSQPPTQAGAGAGGTSFSFAVHGPGSQKQGAAAKQGAMAALASQPEASLALRLAQRWAAGGSAWLRELAGPVASQVTNCYAWLSPTIRYAWLSPT